MIDFKNNPSLASTSIPTFGSQSGVGINLQNNLSLHNSAFCSTIHVNVDSIFVRKATVVIVVRYLRKTIGVVAKWIAGQFVLLGF